MEIKLCESIRAISTRKLIYDCDEFKPTPEILVVHVQLLMLKK